MVETILFVEGGGDSKTLRTACRRGFKEFLAKAGLHGRQPRIDAAGARHAAFENFRTALQQGKSAMLLVDSEEQFNAGSVWEHLAQRPGDGWKRPDNAAEDSCHLMVQCMESWLLTDRATLTAFFGQGFNMRALPAEGRPIEDVAKATIYDALKHATKDCKTKLPYGKGEHSFLLLARIDPQKTVAAAPTAAAFVEAVKSTMAR